MNKVISAIRKYKTFLITAHVNLEGDSLGSQLAMKQLVHAMGRKAVIVDSDSVPDHYRFLPGADEVSTDVDAAPDFDALIVLDCPTLKRIGRVNSLIRKNTPIINIDHHVSNELFGNVNWVDPRASSAGELVYRLFKKTGAVPTKESALALYIAILTDTGSFNYDNTSSVTHEIAGDLLGYGLNPASVSESVYERRTLADIKLLGLALSTLKVNKAGEVAYLELTRAMIRKSGADIARSEGLINFARSIEDVKAALIFKEDAKLKDRINVSFRSKGDLDVNGVAAYFGGGGHIKASGCTIKGTIASVKKRVMKRVEEELKKI